MGEIEGGLGPYVNAGVPVNGTDEVQTITPSAVPASGTFMLQFEGFKTASLAYNVSAAAMQTALNAISSIGTGGVAVSLDGGTGVYTITFSGSNLAKRAQSMISVVNNTVLDSGEAAVTLTVAEGTAGVSGTALGAGAGALLIDTTNKTLYQNTGTAAAPTWSLIASGITVGSAVVNALVKGVAAGYKLARGVATIDADSKDVVTGLTTVVAAVCSMVGDPSMTHMSSSVTVGNQTGAPAAGSIRIKSWKPTAANDCTPIAATSPFANVSWIAIGT
ncbi:MAG: hypothetical protein CVU42_13840 [Chloroflexi bacterium HGW-Chloroflexi-4]|jgi:hypothetical protein|nr:MAG: hypothetical protein CVU42_13840 [Chloroflexi bacterium HGW-Chloroflexi-4]